MNEPSFFLRYTLTRLGRAGNLSTLAGTGILLAVLFASTPVLAHGFAYKYDLPLPLNLYVFGSSAIVLISFLMLVWWGKRTEALLNLKLSHTFKNTNFYWIHRIVGTALGTFSIILLAAILLAGFFGDLDQNPSKLDVDHFEAELKAKHKNYTFHRYSNAQHAFNDPYNPVRYDQEASRDSWPKLIEFFDEALKN